MTDPATIEWRTPELVGQIIGWQEALLILGVTYSTLWRWLEPGTGPHGPTGTYMIEPARITAGYVWFRCDVERFAQIRTRRRSGPAKRKVPATT